MRQSQKARTTSVQQVKSYLNAQDKNCAGKKSHKSRHSCRHKHRHHKRKYTTSSYSENEDDSQMSESSSSQQTDSSYERWQRDRRHKRKQRRNEVTAADMQNVIIDQELEGSIRPDLFAILKHEVQSETRELR